MASTRERVDKDGKVRYVALYRDPAGKQKSAGTFRTRKLALDAAKAEEVDQVRGEWAPKSTMTLTEFAEPWINDQKLKSKSTDLTYWKNHVKPAFGDWKVSDITTHDVQQWLNKKKATCKQGTREKMRNLLSKLMDAAAKRTPPLIKYNPVKGTDVGSEGAPVKRPYPWPKEVNAICDGLDPTDALIVRLFYACGPRASELQRLDVHHFNADEQTIFLPGEKTYAAARTVPVPPNVCALLEAHCEGREPNEPLFIGPRLGRRLDLSNWRPRTFNAARDRAGVADNVDLHALRHGALTNWAKWKIAEDLPELMEWSGHSDIRTMMIYRHHFSSIKPGRAAKLDAMMNGGPGADVVPILKLA